MFASKEIVLPKQRFLVNSDLCPDFVPQMFDPYYWTNKNQIFGTSKGRGTTYFVGEGNNRYVLRHYRRGGFISKFIKDGFFYPGRENSRSYREFRLLDHLYDLGINVPKPVAAHISLNHYPIARYDILVSYIEGSQDLSALLQQRSLTSQELQKISNLLLQLQKHNIYHSDLNIHNILLDCQGEVWVIDFDKGSIEPGRFTEMILRLKRSFIKEMHLNQGHFNWTNQQFEELTENFRLS